jgi:hypothetical protein
VPVDDDEPFEAVINQAAQNFIEQPGQGLRGDGDGPRISHVVGGPSIPAGRGHDRFGDPRRILGQAIGHQSVVAQGKVQAVLFCRSKRDDNDAVFLQITFDFSPSPLVEIQFFHKIPFLFGLSFSCLEDSK